MIYGTDGWGGAMWGGTQAVVSSPRTFGDFFNNDAWDAQDAAGEVFNQDAGEAAGASSYGANGALTTKVQNIRRMLIDGMMSTLSLSEDGEAVPVELKINPYAFYTIEVMNQAGEKLGTVQTWSDGWYEADVGESARLTFKVPRSEVMLSAMTHPNILVLRDRYGFVLDRFRARRSSEYNDGEGLFVNIRARSLLDQLSREPVIDYAKEAPVSEHLALLFAGQRQTPAIALGAIDSAIASFPVAVEGSVSNVLAMLRAIQEQLPAAISGHFYISNNFEFRWRATIGETNKRFVMGKNLLGVRKSIDDEDLITELHMYGEGQDGQTRPSYIVQKNVDLYGLVPFVKVDRRIRKQETLVARGNAIIEQFCNPRVTIEIDALDLAKADVMTYFELGDYYVGGKYRVEDPGQGISEELTVIGIRYDLSNPVAVQLKSATRNQSLADVLNDAQGNIPASTNVNEGNNWENISRIYNGTERTEPIEDRYRDLEYRDGDLGYFDDGLNFFESDPDRWALVTPTYIVPNAGLLPTSVGEGALARTSDNGKLKKRNQANDAWEDIGSSVWEEADSFEELNNSVTRTMLGRVNDGDDRGTVYIRNYDNTLWIPFAPVKEVAELPPIPAQGMRMVYWTSDGDGTGDDQIWVAYAGQSKYTPMQKYSSLSGVPLEVP